jgi:hypothetical protein
MLRVRASVSARRAIALEDHAVRRALRTFTRGAWSICAIASAKRDACCAMNALRTCR